MDTELDYTTSFGYWVRRRRIALDLTQKALASQVGCATVTIKKIEADERRPSQQMAERLADSLAIASEQRALFIRSARGELAVDRLDLPQEPAAAPPAFLQQSAANLAQKAEFVAREPELQKLQQFLDAALDGQGCIAFVTGEAGQGKTSLLSEMARRAQDAHVDLIVASGNCNAFSGAGDPYLPFRDMLGMLSGDVEPRWAAGAISREHAIRLWNLMPHTVQALLDHGPDLNGVFVSASILAKRAAAAAPAGADWPARLLRMAERQPLAPGELEQRQIFEQYTQVLRALATKQPLLLLLDDLQWADGASIDLLFQLGRRLAGSRIMILGAYRPSDVALVKARTSSSAAQQHPLLALVSEFKRQYGDIQLKLGELGAVEGRGFVNELLDREPNQLGESFRAALYERTQGHPLFTVELLRDMQERGDLIQDDAAHWVAADNLDWEALPVRVEAVIEQRIGRLEPALRDILEVASIEGEIFTAQVVARVQKLEVRAVLHQISRELGTRHRLVREHEDETAGEQRLSRFRFTHTVIQAYLYNRLNTGERRLLHGEVAAALEHLYGGKSDAPILRLARHYAAAGERERALAYFHQAAQRAAAVYAYEEAIQHLQAALDLLEVGEQETRIALLEQLADVHTLLGERSQAIPIYQEALDLWSDRPGLDKLTAVRLHRKAGETVVFMTQYEDRQHFVAIGQAHLKSALTLVEGEPPHPEIVRLLATLSQEAGVDRVTIAWDTAERFAGAAVAMAERLDAPVELSDALGALARAYGGRGLFRERVHVSLRRLGLSRDPRFSNVRERAKILQETGHALAMVGEYLEALPHLEQAERLSIEIVALDHLSQALRHQTICAFRLDRWDKVLEIESRLRGLKQRYPNFAERVGPTCYAIALYASVRALRGEFDQARALRNEAKAIMTANDGPPEGWARDNLY